AAWTFVLWGAYHGVLVTLERILGSRRDVLPAVLQHVITLALVVVGWVLFRATSAGHAFTMISAMFGAGSATVDPPHYDAWLLPAFAQFAFVVGVVIALAPIASKYLDLSRIRIPAAASALARIGYVVLFLAAAIHLTNMRITPLIYFKF
ncbi:MAG: hypothetical protein WKG01_26710, partial [Kofleriaceae bacterium]